MKLPVSVIILTFNEERNIRTTIESVVGWAEDVFLVDSISTDRTVEIAAEFGVKVFCNPWKNYATQFNWALENLPLKTEWIMRLDADEKVMPELRAELEEKLPRMNDGVTALYVKRRVLFMGKWMKRGGYYPVWLLRLWRKGCASCEERWMDEHMKHEGGATLFLENDIVDDNRNNLHWWIAKHNGYATREAIDMLLVERGVTRSDVSASLRGSQEQKKRWVKEQLYARMPLFLRPCLYFLYRYMFKLGLLDGREGLIWHFLQGFWYRFLVDAKIYEIKRKMAGQGIDFIEVIRSEYGVEI